MNIVTLIRISIILLSLANTGCIVVLWNENRKLKKQIRDKEQ